MEKFKGDQFEILRYLLRGGAVQGTSDKPRLVSGVHLSDGGSVDRHQLGRLWGDALGIAYINLDKTLFQAKALQKIPIEWARDHWIIPLYELGDVLTVATAFPNDRKLIDEAAEIVGRPISPVFALPDAIEDAVEIQYQSVDVLEESLAQIAENPLFKTTQQVTAAELKKVSEDETIVELVRGLLLLAVRERASDIHFDPEIERLCVRFRVDGVLQDRMDIERPLSPPIISYLKILADLDITERRRPQDGRVRIELVNRTIDFRFSTVPTIHGEKVVLRVLGQMQSQEVPELTELNFTKNVHRQILAAAHCPNGIFFVTGPTGSGKSTTLFSVLKHLNSRNINIMTIEDPVEYQLRGINQIQVNMDLGLDFAMALRAFLRQDPDVILVGEIRDYETAKIAAEAALTGHLVLATMHTNNAIQVVTRLIEIGVEPYLVAPALVGAMSQRLVRRICESCKEAYQLTPEEIQKYFEWDGYTPVSFYRGKGCPECNNTGYKGRIAIFEIFLTNSNLRTLIARNATIGEIEEASENMGYKSLRYDGMMKVLRGHTTIDELERVTVSQEDNI